MKKFLKQIGEEGSAVQIIYVDRNMELIGKCPKREFEELKVLHKRGNESDVNSILDKYNEDFRPILYERLSKTGKEMVDSYIRGGGTSYMSKEQLEETKKDNGYVQGIWNVPLFKKTVNGAVTVNISAVEKVGFPLGYCLSKNQANPLDYAKSNVLYEMKSKEELTAEMTEKVVETVGLKKGFETFVAENIVEAQLGNYTGKYTFSNALGSEIKCNESGCASGLTYYYETLMLHDRYESDIREIQEQMIREGKNPYVHNEDPDIVKDGEVKKAYGFVLTKLDRSSEKVDRELENILPYRSKNYGIAKEILHEFTKEKKHTLSLGL